MRMRLPFTRGRSIASVLALALAACGSKKEPPPAPGSASAAEPARGSAAAPAPAPATPAPTAEATPPAPANSALPAECNEYRETIKRLAQCGDALPKATRDNLQSHFEQQWAGWEKLPEQEKRTLAAICKSSSDNVRVAAAAGCGW
jgi:hypothetical protein